VCCGASTRSAVRVRRAAGSWSVCWRWYRHGGCKAARCWRTCTRRSWPIATVSPLPHCSQPAERLPTNDSSTPRRLYAGALLKMPYPDDDLCEFLRVGVALDAEQLRRADMRQDARAVVRSIRDNFLLQSE